MADIERKKYILSILVIIVLIGYIGPVAAVGWSWETETVDERYWTNAFYGMWPPSIALDSAGNPHIVYTLSSGDLGYTW